MATQCCLKPNESSLVCVEKCLQLTLFVYYTCKPYQKIVPIKKKICMYHDLRWSSIQRATTLILKWFSKSNCFKNKTQQKQNIYVCTVKFIYCYEYVLSIYDFYTILQAVFCHKRLHCFSNTVATQSVNILLLGRRFRRNKNVFV